MVYLVFRRKPGIFQDPSSGAGRLMFRSFCLILGRMGRGGGMTFFKTLVVEQRAWFYGVFVW